MLRFVAVSGERDFVKYHFSNKQQKTEHMNNINYYFLSEEITMYSVLIYR